MPRPVLLGLGVVLVFGLTVAILWQVMPQPRQDVDYLVIGGMATMVSMAVLFAALLKTSAKGGDVFFKRRKP